jgi:hypothetical protein
MSAHLLAALVLAATPTVEAYPSTGDAAAALAPRLQTGTLLFSEGDCLAIRVYTKSRYTHVATVVVCDGEPIVYDSTNGVGVRRMTLPDYLAAQHPDELHVFEPQRPFTPEAAAEFQQHLDEQLGRPYAIAHHLTAERADGLHCAEYVTDALMAANVMKAQQPSKVSPASLAQGAVQSELYAAATTIHVQTQPVAAPVAGNWCERLWLDTKRCTANCCVQMRRWFLCR